MPTELVPSEIRSPEDERKLVDKIKARYDEASRWDLPWKDQAFDAWLASNDTLDTEDWPYLSQVFEPETRRVVDENLEAIMQAVFGRDEGFDLKPGAGQNSLQREKMLQTMKFVEGRRIGYKALKYSQFMECITFGHGIQMHFTKPYIYRKLVKNMVPGPLGQMMPQPGVVDSVEYWPAGRIVSRFDFFPAPFGNSIDNMPYCFVVERQLLDGLKYEGEQHGYQHLDDLKGTALYAKNEGLAYQQEMTLTYNMADRLAAIGIGTREGLDTPANVNADRYSEKLWYFEANPWGSGCGRVTLLSEWKVLKDWPKCPWLHGQKPLSEIFFARLADPDCWHSIGLPKAIQSYQNRLNDSSSLIRDILQETAFPSLLVDQTKLAEGTRLDHFDYAPGRKIGVVGSPSQVSQALLANRIPGEVWQDMDLSRAGIQRLSKVFDAVRNQSGRSTGMTEATKTAAGLSMVMNASKNALTFKLLYAEETGIKKGLELDLALVQEVLTDEQVVRVSDPPPILSPILANGEMSVGPEDVAGEWSIEPVGASQAANSDEKLQRFVLWYKEWSQHPVVGPLLAKTAVAAARMSGRVMDVPDLDKLLPQEAEQMAQMIMQQQQKDAAEGKEMGKEAQHAKTAKDKADAIKKTVEAAKHTHGILQPTRIGSESEAGVE